MEFISVVHRPCIGLLRLTAETVKRDWSHVPWRVLVQDDSLELAQQALAEFPNIRVEACWAWNRHWGWIAQQMIKLSAAANSSSEWVAVIGPGNFLIGSDPFFSAEGLPWIELRPDHTLQFAQWWQASQARRATVAAAPSVLTPWVWRPDLVRSALAEEPPLAQWQEIPGGTEQLFYWSWAHSRCAYRPRQLTQGLVQPVEQPERWLRWSQTNPAPWFVLHRTAWARPDHVRTALDVLINAGSIDDRVYSQTWEDYLKGRWT